jgi:hypothetical protein
VSCPVPFLQSWVAPSLQLVRCISIAVLTMGLKNCCIVCKWQCCK